MVTTFELPGGYKYRLEYSTDGTTWSTFDDHTSDQHRRRRPTTRFADKPVTARYLRLTVTGSSGNGGSVYELQAYGELLTVRALPGRHRSHRKRKPR